MRKAETDYILTTMLETHTNVSDLNITVEKPLQVETSGLLKEVPIKPSIGKLTPFQTETLALNLIGSDRRLCEMLIREGSCDASYFLAGKARFRVNVFSQRNYLSIILRRLETRIPTIEDLSLPKAFHSMAAEKNGIIVITGATGSGKSTSLAALLDKINNTKSVHVITLEDPIEFVHTHKKATFNQRELGSDFDTFATGLRAALRQAPKIILVGEMRDRETVEIGLSASETGHLVLSTLHTVDAGSTINRIIGMFDKDEENQIRNRLADSMRWIVCQRLLPRYDSGRVAAFEIMGNSLRVKETILHGESEGKTFYEIINEGETYNMITFDKSILTLYEKRLISAETALAYCSRKAIVRRGIDNIKSQKGERTTDIEDLEIDEEYKKDNMFNKKEWH